MQLHRLIGAVLVLFLSACQSDAILQQDNDLSAAGFTLRIADTAERQAMMHRLPPNQFVQRVSERNVADAASQLTTRSKILADLVSGRKLLVVGAMHDVSTGAVSWLGGQPT